MNSKVIGIDPSLTCSGIVILQNGEIIDKINIKTKPNRPTAMDELHRLMSIVKQIEEIIKKYAPIEIATLEGLAFGAVRSKSITQLFGLNYLIRYRLYKLHKSGDLLNNFLVIPPTQLKKFVTGKGNTKKDMILKEVYKRYNVDLDNDNLADAFGLAKIGEAYLMEDKDTLVKFQKEVIDLL